MNRKLFFGLFIFPLLIAVGMILLLSSVVFLTNEKETPESLITAIKTGSESKRWQKAYELSNELNSSARSIRSQGLVREMLSIFNDTQHYDAKTRGYMALALSHFNEPEIIKALTDALDESELDIQIFCLWSLGVLEAKGSAPKIAPLLQSDRPELRKMAAYVLGIVGGKENVRNLEPLLNDPDADIRWNSALSLARLGNDAGINILIKMLDRDYLQTESVKDEAQIQQIMINATKGLALIKNEKSIKILEFVAKNEKNLKVRQAAIEAIK